MQSEQDEGIAAEPLVTREADWTTAHATTSSHTGTRTPPRSAVAPSNPNGSDHGGARIGEVHTNSMAIPIGILVTANELLASDGCHVTSE